MELLYTKIPEVNLFALTYVYVIIIILQDKVNLRKSEVQMKEVAHQYSNDAK